MLSPIDVESYHNAFIQKWYDRTIAESFGGKAQPWLLEILRAGDFQAAHHFVNKANTIKERSVVHMVISNPGITNTLMMRKRKKLKEKPRKRDFDRELSCCCKDLTKTLCFCVATLQSLETPYESVS